MTPQFQAWLAALIDVWLAQAGSWRGTAGELHGVLVAVAREHDAGPDLVPRGAVLSRAVRLAAPALALAGWRVTFSRSTGRRCITFVAIVAQADDDDAAGK